MSLDQLCDSLIKGIETCIQLKHNPPKRFAPYGAVNSLLRDRQHELRELFRHLFDFHRVIPFRLERIIDRTLGADNQRPGLCNILATLLFMRGGASILKQFEVFVLSGEAISSYTDDNLPFDLETCNKLFPEGGRGGDFFREQFQFCSVVLKKHQDVICQGHKASCPLPYLEEEPIGSGAFGAVYKVLIERGHLRDGAAGYDSPVYFARKDFELDPRRGEKAFREEMKVVKEILQQSKTHKNIMVTQCSLEYGNRFSLFFDLAECNLWEYLSNMDVMAPSTPDQKYAIFHRGVELAGALAFLHDELTWKSTPTRLSCYHLDLKPHNILVVKCKDGVERWKITDFGMSRVKPVSKVKDPVPGLERTSTFGDIDLGRHFRRRRPPINSPTALASTENKRGEGTYLAPETVLIGDGRVGAESDVWSFGCVFSLVITFIGSGPSGVLDFDEFRRHSGGNHFFKTNKELNEAQVNPRVLEWFDRLHRSALQRDPVEGLIFGETIELLKSKVLVVDRLERQKTKAEEVQKELRQIASKFPGTTPAMDYLPKPTPRRSIPREFSETPKSRKPSQVLKRIAKNVLPQSSSTQQNLPLAWRLKASGAMSAAMFSPDGELLAFFSPALIELYSVNKIRNMSVNETPEPLEHFEPPSFRAWGGFCLNSAYLCTYSRIGYFECQFIPLSTQSRLDASSITNAFLIRRQTVAPVQKLAISQDSTLVACAVKVKSFQNFNSTEVSSTEVYLFRMKDLLHSTGDEPLSPVSTLDSLNFLKRSDSSMSNVSTSFPPPWKSIIQEGNIGQIAGIRGMKFSKDGSVLALVTEPTPSVDPVGNPVLKVTVTCWSTRDGRLLPPFDVNNEGQQDLTSSFLTTYSLFNTRPEFLVISQQNSIYHHSQVQEKISRRMNLRLHDTLLTEDDEGVILLGDNGTQKVLNIYTLPTTNIEHSESASWYCKIDLTSYDASTDSMCLSTHQGRREILVATKKKTKKTLISIPTR